MKKIDWYIFKRYLITFTAMLLMFIPIGIIIDVSEKVNRMIENKVAFKDVLVYYYGFTIYFANLLFPIFLFLSIIWFTSKLANNSEIIAILSSGISFTRFLRPYLIGATLVSLVTLLMGFFILPDASEKYWDFRYTYLKRNVETRQTSDIFRQVTPNEYMYVSSYNVLSKTGFDFIYEKFKDNKLEYKLYANRIKYNEKTKDYSLFNYVKRTIGKDGDVLDKQEKHTQKFEFEPDDLTPTVYVAETMNIFDLVKFIDKERTKGSSNLDVYLVVLYKKFSIPASAFILTIIAVAVSAMKRRGGMGVNLAIGILVAFSFVFFDKIFGTLAEKSSIPPIVAVWFPNFVFGILAFYLLRNARR
ncbi:MAG: LptF/LptG family permease [Bacteroidota bacterium]